MGHEVHLENKLIRTDLAIDMLDSYPSRDGIKTKMRQEKNCHITVVDVLKNGADIIGKKEGRYITVEFDDVTDHENQQNVLQVVTKELTELLKEMKIPKDASCFIVGLGNEESTPDALGPLTIDDVLVTNHLYELDSLEDGFRKTYALTPGVMGTTGIETRELLKGIIDEIEPDFMIVIDALASGSIDRLNKTIQITDTGIHPGSGVNNKRKEISKEYFQIPVIAVGVPTVVDAATIVADTIHYMQMNFTYMKKRENLASNKLSVGSGNYLKKEVIPNKEDKVELMGKLGLLNETEMKQLVFEALTPIGYNLMVTPKEIDFVIKKLALTIGGAINHALHENISFEN
ncbi:MAG: GPR endopeptidase [Firmicutes bacterium]|nr:GPR endopeptidase [Bacillota bacterium]